MQNKCPECGSLLEIHDISYIKALKYTALADEPRQEHNVLVCRNYPQCDNYAIININDKHKDIVRVANSFLRELRIQTHLIFDIIWQAKIKTRDCAYSIMSKEINRGQPYNHIRCCGVFDCIKIIIFSLNFISENFDKINFSMLSNEQLSVLKYAAEFSFDKNSIEFSGKEFETLLSLIYNNSSRKLIAINTKRKTCTFKNPMLRTRDVYNYTGDTLLQCTMSVTTEIYNQYAHYENYKPLTYKN